MGCTEIGKEHRTRTLCTTKNGTKFNRYGTRLWAIWQNFVITVASPIKIKRCSSNNRYRAWWGLILIAALNPALYKSYWISRNYHLRAWRKGKMCRIGWWSFTMTNKGPQGRLKSSPRALWDKVYHWIRFRSQDRRRKQIKTRSCTTIKAKKNSKRLRLRWTKI